MNTNTDSMHPDCVICGETINRYTDRWYTVLDHGELYAIIVCESCADNAPDGLTVIDMTDDRSQAEVAHAACTGQ